MSKKDYGYKVCYKEFGKHKLKIHLICNTYDLAVWSIQYYEKNIQLDGKIKNIINKPTWYILPIKNYFEFRRLWKDCPF